jgi:hypothetical protein
VKKKRAIFITGSGKCGTSVVAYSFFAAGFPMGGESELCRVQGGAGNIRGTWEHVKVREFNVRLLEHNNATWDKLPEHLPLSVDSGLEREMTSFIETLPDEFCCKEPRLVWTADVWAKYFREIIIVAAFRNPLGFSQSIASVWPDQFRPLAPSLSAPSLELEIWERTNRRLLNLQRWFPCYWICFDDSPKMIKARIKEITDSLGGNFSEAAFDDFYVPDAHRHSSNEDVMASLKAKSSIGQLYRTLLSFTRT